METNIEPKDKILEKGELRKEADFLARTKRFPFWGTENAGQGWMRRAQRVETLKPKKAVPENYLWMKEHYSIGYKQNPFFSHRIS
jgi:hypothetical protein